MMFSLSFLLKFFCFEIDLKAGGRLFHMRAPTFCIVQLRHFLLDLLTEDGLRHNNGTMADHYLSSTNYKIS